MTVTVIKRNGLWAWLIECADGTLRLMPPPEFIMAGSIEVAEGKLSNWEWREILKHWRVRVTGDDLRS